MAVPSIGENLAFMVAQADTQVGTQQTMKQ